MRTITPALAFDLLPGDWILNVGQIKSKSFFDDFVKVSIIPKSFIAIDSRGENVVFTDDEPVIWYDRNDTIFIYQNNSTKNGAEENQVDKEALEKER